jgi:hypothetical protein
LEKLVYVQYNNKMLGRKKKAKMNKDPLLDTAATHAQGWLVEGGDHEDVAELRTMCGSRTGGWSLSCVMSD